MKFQPKSLQQRILFYAILPTFVLLIVLSLVGFLFVRNLLITQWKDTTISRLERSADLIEARLREPKLLLMMLQNEDNASAPDQLINHIVSQIRELDIVEEVVVSWPEHITGEGESDKKRAALPDHKEERIQGPFKMSPLEYDERVINRTISLISEFKGMNDETVGDIKIKISFDDLLDHVLNAAWWTTNKAYLLDGSYNVLVTTGDRKDLEDYYPMRIYGTVDQFERRILQAITNKKSGIVTDSGIPPKEVCVFYHLEQVPWTLVVTVPGKKVLAPIIFFLRYYALSLALCTGLILIFMRISMNRMTVGIKQVSRASNDLASGRFGPPLEVITRDEVGELTDNFNKMSNQLKQRLELKKNIELAREVQQSFLPQHSFKRKNIEIQGKVLVRNETGGDYFDILESAEESGKIGIVVGDVVGHGVGAALFMTTVRSLVRSSFVQSGTPEIMLDNVNKLLCQDTENSGGFATLFYLELNQSLKSLRWVRAGHDPAFAINCTTGKFTELKGSGVAIGVDPDWQYVCNELQLKELPQAIVICSDGIFEATNGAGEQFGKQRVLGLLPQIVNFPSEKAVNRIILEIQSFVEGTALDDDITVAVLRLG